MLSSGPNDSAFPTVAEINGLKADGQPGITAREWFAGMALNVVARYPELRSIWTDPKDSSVHRAERVAKWAFAIADAMIAESKK